MDSQVTRSEKQLSVSKIRSADKQTLLKKIYEMDGVKVSTEEQKSCLEGLAYLVNIGEDFAPEEYTEMFHGLAKTFYNKNITVECVLLSLSILSSIIKNVEEAFFISTTLEAVKKRFPECNPYVTRLQTMICEPDSKFISCLCSQSLNSSVSVSSSAMFGIGYMVYNHLCSASSFNEKDLIKIIEKKKEWNYGLTYIVDVLLENCLSNKDFNKMGRIIAAILPNDTSVQKNWDINPFFVQRVVECVGCVATGRSPLQGNILKLPQNLNSLLYLALSLRQKVVSSNGSRYIVPATRYAVLRHMLVKRDTSLTQKQFMDALPDALSDLESTPPCRFALADILSDAMSAPILANSNLSVSSSTQGSSQIASFSSSSSSGSPDGFNGAVSGILLQLMKRLIHDSHPQTACLALNALISASALKPQSSITESSDMKNTRVLARDALLEALHGDDVCRRISSMSDSMRRRMVDACQYMVEEYIGSGSFSTTDNTLGDIIGIIDIILDSDGSTRDGPITPSGQIANQQGSSITSRNVHSVEMQSYTNTRRCLDVLITVVKVYVKTLGASFAVGNIPPSLSNVASTINHVSKIIYRCVEESSGNELNRLAMYLRDLCVEAASLATIIRGFEKSLFSNSEVVQLYNSLLYPISCLVRSSALSDGSFYGSPFTIPIETLPSSPIFEEMFGKKFAEVGDDEIVDFESVIKNTDSILIEMDLKQGFEEVKSQKIEIPCCGLTSIITSANIASQHSGTPAFKEGSVVASPETKISTDELNKKIAAELTTSSVLPSFLSEVAEGLAEYKTTKDEIPLNGDATATDEDVTVKHIFHWRRANDKLHVILEAVLVHSVDARLECRLEYQNENMKVQSSVATLDCNERGHLFTYMGAVSEDNGVNLDCNFLYKEVDWDAVGVGCLRMSVASFMKESQLLQLNKNMYNKVKNTEFVLENFTDTRAAAESISNLLRLGVVASSIDGEDVLTCVLAGVYMPSTDAVFVVLSLKVVDGTTKKRKRQQRKQAVHINLECRSLSDKMNDRVVREITGE